MIDAIALVHQYQRKIEWVKVGDEKIASILVTIEDIEIANKLAPEILGRSLDELPPQTRRMLNLIKELVKTECKEREIEQSEYRFTRRKIREQTGWSLTQVKLHLDRLQEYEYLICRNGKLGRTFEYELLLDVEAPDKKHVIGLIDVKKLKKKHNYDDNLSD